MYPTLPLVALSTRTRCDLLHVEALTRKILHTRQEDRGELGGMLRDVTANIVR